MAPIGHQLLRPLPERIPLPPSPPRTPLRFTPLRSARRRQPPDGRPATPQGWRARLRYAPGGGPDRHRARDGGARHSPARRRSVPLSAWHSATPRAHSAVAPEPWRPHPPAPPPHYAARAPSPALPRARLRPSRPGLQPPPPAGPPRPAASGGARLWPGVFLIASGLPGEGSLRCAPKCAAEPQGRGARRSPMGSRWPRALQALARSATAPASPALRVRSAALRPAMRPPSPPSAPAFRRAGTRRRQSRRPRAPDSFLARDHASRDRRSAPGVPAGSTRRANFFAEATTHVAGPLLD